MGGSGTGREESLDAEVDEAGMAAIYKAQKKTNREVEDVGLRSQAIAIGFVQLCRELRDSGALNDGAIDRIKGAIADTIAIAPPRGRTCVQLRKDVIARLDLLFGTNG